MSFATALGYFLGGQGKAKQQRFENDQQLAQTKANTAERQGQLDYQNRALTETTRRDEADISSTTAAAAQAKLKSDAELRAQGIDPATGKYVPFAYTSPDTRQVNPNNHGKGGAPSPISVSDFYMKRSLALRAAGRTTEADAMADAARTAAQNAQSFAIAGKDTSQIDVNQAHALELRSQADKNQAQAQAISTAQQTAIQIAQGHDRAAWDRNVANIAGRGYVANLQGQQKAAVAKLAGAYMLQGKTMDNAVKQAKDLLDNRERAYLQATSAKEALLNPGAATGAIDPTAPGVNIPPGAVRGTVHTPQGDVKGYQFQGHMYTLGGQQVS